MTYLAMWEYPWKERAFYAIAWTPKATVQAALSGAGRAQTAALPSLIESCRAQRAARLAILPWGED